MATVARPAWLPRTDLAGSWLVRSELREIRQHFVPTLGRSAACKAPEFCVLCAHELKMQRIYALPVSLPDSHIIHLVRLTEKDRAAIDWLERQGSRLIGQLLALSVVGYIDVVPLGRRIIPPVPLANYFAAFGRKAYSAAVESLGSHQPARSDQAPAEVLELKLRSKRKRA